MIAMRKEMIDNGSAVGEELTENSWETLLAQTLSKPCREELQHLYQL